ncbi:copper ion binding protein [Gillisia sp. Hel_I_86]|uniref:heavy-metal-associated domain-containing protein n=1 Tax=Gillisia sp. Hel_I_86 TaxID=1249981 RepID=UPI00119BB891|nr:heavy metal-associated domain-containing protein [Gillisia sp. Hel_I_86]TVZ26899.1 copper ion binding protein [Gillisia sp. Hel_I_86]
MKAVFYSSFLMLFVLLSGCDENSDKSKLTDANLANNVSVEVSIEGMSCMACVAKVKKTLSDLNGITEVNVSLENKSATVQYNPENISLNKIMQSIDEIGYKAGNVKKLPQ